ncbi:MAG: outer membrane protein assembly factor BamE [Zetaproteobacteria bacterium]|nr:outer membrane protein assembly factor BamE [Zetaproteobacteria bacterium]
MKALSLGFICCIFVGMLSGCFTTGKNFPRDLSWLRKQETSKQDVMMLLGRPYAVGSSSGIEVWSYVFFEYQFVPHKSHHRELKLYWDKQDKVKDYSYISSFEDEIPRS